MTVPRFIQRIHPNLIDKQRLAPQIDGSGYKPAHPLGLFVWRLHVLFVLVWVLSRHSGFLPYPRDMQIR